MPAKAVFHRLVQKDVRIALDYYEAEGGVKLGDRFFAEAEATVERVVLNPTSFHHVEQGHELGRAQLRLFPYHFLFRELNDEIHILVLRHDSRHPNFGIHRHLK